MKLKIPFLSKLLEIKEEQLQLEITRTNILKEIYKQVFEINKKIRKNEK